MTEIADDHVEWAVVHRLQMMLESPPTTEFNVTQTYALFMTILCWTTQRIRTPDNGSQLGTIDRSAADVLKKLNEQFIETHPWSIKIDERCAGFRNSSAGHFIIALRGACAHGDGRKIKPYHTKVAGRGQRQLAGFTFQCGKSKTITLLEKDMRHIGKLLAGMFCESVQGIAKNRGDLRFDHDAATVIETAI